MWLVRALPHRFTIWAADKLAARVAGQNHTALVTGLRSNQAVVQGLSQEDRRVHKTVEAVLRNTMHSYISLFEVMDRGHEGLGEIVKIDPPILETMDSMISDARGLLYVGAHTIGLDHLLVYFGGLDYPSLVLAYPEVMPSYQAQNRLRRSFGLNLSPVSFQSLRDAIKHLRQGGLVVTAADRPDESGAHLEFFGKPAWLPIGHVRLAMKTLAPMMLGITYKASSDQYGARCLTILDPQEYIDRPNGEVEMAQRVLREFEEYIRQHPSDWWMFHQVWPEDGGK